MFSKKGTRISRDMCFLGRGTHISRDMCFLGRGTQFTRDIRSWVEEHISLGYVFPGKVNAYD